MDDGHYVVASVGPVVEVDDSIFQAALFQIPEFQTPQWQASHSVRVVPFHYGNRPHSIGAVTTVQEIVDPCGICLQLLKQRKQSAKRLGIGGPNRSKVSCSIVVDSNQDYTKDDMTLLTPQSPRSRKPQFATDFARTRLLLPTMVAQFEPVEIAEAA